MLIATFGTMLFAAAAITQSAVPVTPAEEAKAEDPIVVTGTRIKRGPKPIAEEPYSTTERVPLGSRIARKPSGRRVFNTVATDSGLAGLVGASNGGSFDATGTMGAPIRKRLVKECRADQDEVSEAVACALFDVKKKLDAGQIEAADAELRKLMQSTTLSGLERYYGAHYAYRVAAARADDSGREAALKAMLGTGHMPAAERLGALRTLVAMALMRGDDGAAIGQLETLVRTVPNDAQSLANLAALYAARGAHGEARVKLAAAVGITRANGRPVPQSWIDYLSQAR